MQHKQIFGSDGTLCVLVVMVDTQLCICQNHTPQRVNFIVCELKSETEIDLSFKEDRIEEKLSIYKPSHPTEGVLGSLLLPPAKKILPYQVISGQAPKPRASRLALDFTKAILGVRSGWGECTLR